MRLLPVGAVGPPTQEGIHVGHLPFGIEVEHRVENRVVVRQIDDLPIREHAPHPALETSPLARSEEAVTHQKAAAKEIVTQLCDLIVRELPHPG